MFFLLVQLSLLVGAISTSQCYGMFRPNTTFSPKKRNLKTHPYRIFPGSQSMEATLEDLRNDNTTDPKVLFNDILKKTNEGAKFMSKGLFLTKGSVLSEVGEVLSLNKSKQEELEDSYRTREISEKLAKADKFHNKSYRLNFEDNEISDSDLGLQKKQNDRDLSLTKNENDFIEKLEMNKLLEDLLDRPSSAMSQQYNHKELKDPGPTKPLQRVNSSPDLTDWRESNNKHFSRHTLLPTDLDPQNFVDAMENRDTIAPDWSGEKSAWDFSDVYNPHFGDGHVTPYNEKAVFSDHVDNGRNDRGQLPSRNNAHQLYFDESGDDGDDDLSDNSDEYDSDSDNDNDYGSYHAASADSQLNLDSHDEVRNYLPPLSDGNIPEENIANHHEDGVIEIGNIDEIGNEEINAVRRDNKDEDVDEGAPRRDSEVITPRITREPKSYKNKIAIGAMLAATAGLLYANKKILYRKQIVHENFIGIDSENCVVIFNFEKAIQNKNMGNVSKIEKVEYNNKHKLRITYQEEPIVVASRGMEIFRWLSYKMSFGKNTVKREEVVNFPSECRGTLDSTYLVYYNGEKKIDLVVADLDYTLTRAAIPRIVMDDKEFSNLMKDVGIDEEFKEYNNCVFHKTITNQSSKVELLYLNPRNKTIEFVDNDEQSTLSFRIPPHCSSSLPSRVKFIYQGNDAFVKFPPESEEKWELLNLIEEDI